jgi:hypothetical protein
MQAKEGIRGNTLVDFLNWVVLPANMAGKVRKAIKQVYGPGSCSFWFEPRFYRRGQKEKR